MRALVRLAHIALALVVAGTLSVAGRAQSASLFVTTRALADRLAHDSPVILFVGDQATYDKGHITGAQLITLAELSDAASAPLRLQMAPVDQLQHAFEARGVSETNPIVIYSAGPSMTAAARVFVALDYLGLADRTTILDGGLVAWQAASLPVATTASPVAAGHFTPHPRPAVIVTADWVLAHLKDASVKIVDARTPDYYSGDNTRGFPRPGHIPGAANVPYDSLVDPATNQLKDVAALRQAFQAAGAKTDGDVVSYCHIGQQASQVYVVGRLLGYRVHLYDGSFEEWSAKNDLPVEKGPATIIK